MSILLDPRAELVLIAGAGVAGLTLANDLASRGVAFRVIDPLPDPVRESRAHGMLGRTLMALDMLGLAEPMLAAAKKPVPVLREYFGSKLVAETDFAKMPADPYPLMLPIFQQHVVRALAAALAERGHSVEWRTELKAVAPRGDGVSASVARGGDIQTIEAGWIVGCDGGHSVVRKSITPEFPGESFGLTGLFCECDIDWMRSRDIWWTWQSPQGLVAAIYNDFVGKWHVVALDVEAGELESEASAFERIGLLLRRLSGDENVRLANPNWVHAESSRSQRVAERMIAGRVALAGDAAHVFSSAAGHGVHCAIEDALNLGWKLGLTIAGVASSSLLQTYDLERRAHAADVVRGTRAVQHFMKLRGNLRKTVWGLLYFAGKHLRSISAVAGKQADKLATDYQQSPLSRNETAQYTARTRAGLQAPDAPLRVGGRPSRLLEVIRGPQADLLLFAGMSPEAEVVEAFGGVKKRLVPLREHLRVRYVFPSQAYASKLGMSENDPDVIVDGLQKLHAAFGIREPEAVYLRPDGYIGLRSQNMNEQTLRDYLGLIFAGTLV
jgi:2-polyprenyl-6-methoxyphenol hydroxylase-like FAD-dependent oxidoreductase